MEAFHLLILFIIKEPLRDAERQKIDEKHFITTTIYAKRCKQGQKDCYDTKNIFLQRDVKSQ